MGERDEDAEDHSEQTEEVLDLGDSALLLVVDHLAYKSLLEQVGLDQKHPVIKNKVKKRAHVTEQLQQKNQITPLLIRMLQNHLPLPKTKKIPTVKTSKN